MRLQFRSTGCSEHHSRYDLSPHLALMQRVACSKPRGASTWLTRIAINSALMILRKKRGSRETAMEVPAQLDTKRPEWEVADHASNPEEECAQSEIENILRAEIRDLRPTVRAVFEIKHLQEFSPRETAGKMGISLSAAKARAFHGKSALRKALTLRMNYRGGDSSLPHNVGTVHRRRLSQE
jgi:RNA polymerase sigma factor (sigma-70 family)